MGAIHDIVAARPLDGDKVYVEFDTGELRNLGIRLVPLE